MRAAQTGSLWRGDVQPPALDFAPFVLPRRSLGQVTFAAVTHPVVLLVLGMIAALVVAAVRAS
jgi:hypothetical protein